MLVIDCRHTCSYYINMNYWKCRPLASPQHFSHVDHGINQPQMLLRSWRYLTVSGVRAGANHWLGPAPQAHCMRGASLRYLGNAPLRVDSKQWNILCFCRRRCISSSSASYRQIITFYITQPIEDGICRLVELQRWVYRMGRWTQASTEEFGCITFRYFRSCQNCVCPRSVLFINMRKLR